MTAVFLFIRLVEFIAVVALIGFIAKIVWDKLWPAIKKLIDKKAEYYENRELSWLRLLTTAAALVLYLVFVLLFCFVLLVLLSVSVAISQLAEKAKRLAQSNALLEKRVRELENKLDQH